MNYLEYEEYLRWQNKLKDHIWEIIKYYQCIRKNSGLHGCDLSDDEKGDWEINVDIEGEDWLFIEQEVKGSRSALDSIIISAPKEVIWSLNWREDLDNIIIKEAEEEERRKAEQEARTTKMKCYTDSESGEKGVLKRLVKKHSEYVRELLEKPMEE